MSASDSIPGIAYTFRQPELLTKALTHRSRGRQNYERLEFLGDAVLGFVVASRLFRSRPDVPEGDLSRHGRLLYTAQTEDEDDSEDDDKLLEELESHGHSGGHGRGSFATLIPATYASIAGGSSNPT